MEHNKKNNLTFLNTKSYLLIVWKEIMLWFIKFSDIIYLISSGYKRVGMEWEGWEGLGEERKVIIKSQEVYLTRNDAL